MPYTCIMARTTIDLDREKLELARRALGTKRPSETVNAALAEVARRSALADFDVLADIDIGTPEEIEAGRSVRGPHDVA